MAENKCGLCPGGREPSAEARHAPLTATVTVTGDVETGLGWYTAVSAGIPA